MPVDKLLIKQRLGLISDFLEELKGLANLPEKEFLNKINSAAAESFLRRCLVAILDIGRHILSKNGGTDMALEYKGIARGLVEKNIIDEKLGQQLVQMASYRNRLVHLYHQVSNEELFHIINNDLDDIKDFVNQINSYLQKLKNKGPRE